jgi:hypothetical protein
LREAFGLRFNVLEVSEGSEPERKSSAQETKLIFMLAQKKNGAVQHATAD